MDEKDSEKPLWDHVKALWNSVPDAIRLLGTILGIIIAFKALFPAAIVEINSFDASPEIIESGVPSTLSWSVSGANNVSIEPEIGAVGSNGSLSISPSETTTYKLIATGKGKEDVALRTVTVKEKSILINQFNVSPDSIKSGESAVLIWQVEGVENVTIEPEIGTAAAEGSLSVSPQQTTTYKLIASTADEETIAYSTIRVEDSPENNPAPEESSPAEGILATENNIATQETSPSQENLPSQRSLPTQENLPSQENLPPAEESASTQENFPTIESFNAVPDVVRKGESSDLTWSVSEATKVSIEPGIGTVALKGSQRVFPEETTIYTLTATNEAGSIDATKVVYVQQSSEPAVPTSPSTSNQTSPANGTVFENSTSRTAS